MVNPVAGLSCWNSARTSGLTLRRLQLRHPKPHEDVAALGRRVLQGDAFEVELDEMATPWAGAVRELSLGPGQGQGPTLR